MTIKGQVVTPKGSVDRWAMSITRGHMEVPCTDIGRSGATHSWRIHLAAAGYAADLSTESLRGIMLIKFSISDQTFWVRCQAKEEGGAKKGT